MDDNNENKIPDDKNENLSKETKGHQGHADDNDDEEDFRKPRPQRFKPRSVDELLLAGLPERAKYASEYLRSLLQGKIVFDILPINKKFLVSWNTEENKEKELLVVELTQEITEVDCTIIIHGKDLLRIFEGDLNPQVLLLSHKAKVEGNSKLATYIFNLIAPQG